MNYGGTIQGAQKWMECLSLHTLNGDGMILHGRQPRGKAHHS